MAHIGQTASQSGQRRRSYPRLIFQPVLWSWTMSRFLSLLCGYRVCKAYKSRGPKLLTSVVPSLTWFGNESTRHRREGDWRIRAIGLHLHSREQYQKRELERS